MNRGVTCFPGHGGWGLFLAVVKAWGIEFLFVLCLLCCADVQINLVVICADQATMDESR